MGFMYTDQEHNDKADERMLFVDFWRCLKGDEHDGVLTDNLKKLLSVIEGIVQEFKKSPIRKKVKDHRINTLEQIMRTKGGSRKDTSSSCKNGVLDLVSYTSKGTIKIES